MRKFDAFLFQSVGGSAYFFSSSQKYSWSKSTIAKKVALTSWIRGGVKNKKRKLDDLVNNFFIGNKKATLLGGFFWMRSLAVSYSHMGRPHTTIGAIAFHFWVRDGIRWFHNAMAAKQNWFALFVFNVGISCLIFYFRSSYNFKIIAYINPSGLYG